MHCFVMQCNAKFSVLVEDFVKKLKTSQTFTLHVPPHETNVDCNVLLSIFVIAEIK